MNAWEGKATAGSRRIERARSTRELVAALVEVRARTLELIEDLDDDQMMGPRLPIVNPLRWEVGHVAYFQEFWIARHTNGLPALMENSDSIYDSARVAHDTRWDLPLPTKAKTIEYMHKTLDRTLELATTSRARERDGYDQDYFLELALLHECMHAEAITYTRQTLGYACPLPATCDDADLAPISSMSVSPTDVAIAGGTFVLGSSLEDGFAFDNELQEHEVEVKPFAISRTAVSNGEFVAFVEDQGYSRRGLWSEEGWQWREAVGARHPVYWRREPDGLWMRRVFDRWVPLEPRKAVIHVNWYEADAFCRWAGRRLPTEAEWEFAACADRDSNGKVIEGKKRRYPWGDDPPSANRANLDWRNTGCIDVEALPSSDSAFGIRQMIGNSWEWTATDFGLYPGFAPGPYKEYSEPWFGDHKVLRGGCWATRSILIHNAYRNFYKPDRRDVWAGFRTCAFSVE